jgi:hypothetical protein
MSYFEYNHFAYHRLIRHYIELFGAEKVLVLPYEWFRREPEMYANKIVDFAGGTMPENLPYDEQVNLAPTTFAMTLQRRLNPIAAGDSVNPWVLVRSPRVKRFVHRVVRNLSRLVPDSVNKNLDAKMQKRIAQLTGDRYRESNRLTGEIIGQDLAQFGYDL